MYVCMYVRVYVLAQAIVMKKLAYIFLYNKKLSF